jgi:hypothetical protein
MSAKLEAPSNLANLMNVHAAEQPPGRSMGDFQ